MLNQVIRTVTRQLKDIAEGNVESIVTAQRRRAYKDLGGNMGISGYALHQGAGSVVSQIFFLYNFDVVYWGDNIDHEKSNYVGKKKDDDREFENTPIDAFNHAADAIRYGVFTHLSRTGYNMDKIIIK